MVSTTQYRRHHNRHDHYHRGQLSSGASHGGGTCAESPCRVEREAAAEAPDRGLEAAGEDFGQARAEEVVVLGQARVVVEEQPGRALGSVAVAAADQGLGEVVEGLGQGQVVGAAELVRVGQGRAAVEVVLGPESGVAAVDLGPELAAEVEGPGRAVQAQEAAAAGFVRE